MSINYEFLPGLKPNYTGKIRSFVLRNRKQRARKRVQAWEDHRARLAALQPPDPSADAQALVQGQLDPFDTSAIATTVFENRLLHHFIQSCIPHIGTRRQGSFFPPRDIDWRTVRESPLVTLCAMSFTCMSLIVVEVPNAQRELKVFSQQLHVRTLEALNAQLLLERSNISESTMYVLTGLISAYVHIMSWSPPPSYDRELRLHIMGLRAALIARHGWQLHRYGDSIRWELVWQDITTRGEISKGMTPISSHILNAPCQLDDPALDTGSPTSLDVMYAHEFLGAYTNFYQTALLRAQEMALKSCDLAVPEPRDLVSPGTVAHETLRSATNNVIKSLAPVLLLNIQLFEQRDASAEENLYQYWALRRKFRQCDVGLGNGPVYMVWALGMSPDLKYWADLDAMALLSRMLTVDARFSDQTREKLRSMLLSIATVQSLDETETWWTPLQFADVLRQELPFLCEAE